MRLYYGGLDLTDFPFSIVWGSDFGAPQNVSQAMPFLLQDGEIELSDRASNRTLGFTVLVEGSDLAEIAANEALLHAEFEKQLNTITLDPEDFGPATVFTVFRAQTVHARDDDGELSRLRLWNVSVNAQPFVQSADEVVTPALATNGTTTTLVDNASSAAGWTATIDGVTASITAAAGTLTVDQAAVTGSVTIAMTRTGSIATSATKYLVVDWKTALGDKVTAKSGLRVYADGAELSRVGQFASPTAGYTRTYFYVPAASITALVVSSTTVAGGGELRARSLTIDNIDRTDIKPSLGTAHQLLRSIEVTGAVRTPGRVAIEHATSALGDVIAYFWPDHPTTTGYSPPLRQYRVSGGTVTADSAMVSGSRETLGVSTTHFQVPVWRLPEGAYVLVARVSVPTTGTISWTANTLVNGVVLGPSVSGQLTTTLGGVYANVALARIQLPTRALTLGSNGYVRVTLTAPAVDAVTLDEAWLFHNSGQLTMTSCGTGTPSAGGPANRLFMEPATVETPRPIVRIGYAADGSDAYYPPAAGPGSNLGPTSWQMPVFTPSRVNVFTVTSNALDASVTLRHRPSWHTHAAS